MPPTGVLAGFDKQAGVAIGRAHAQNGCATVGVTLRHRSEIGFGACRLQSFLCTRLQSGDFRLAGVFRHGNQNVPQIQLGAHHIVLTAFLALLRHELVNIVFRHLHAAIDLAVLQTLQQHLVADFLTE